MAGNDAFYQAYVEVIPTAKGFERSLSGQMTGPSAVAGGVAGGAAGKGFVGGFGKMIPLLGGVLAAAGIGNIIGDAIANGSDNQQSFQAVEQVYGDLGAAAIKAFAEAGAKNIGQSMNDILSASSLLGTFGKAAGLAGPELVDFSKDIITLGADLSSFANTSPEEAVEALSAGLRGESEPLRKYGVLLDDATLKARAMEMGIYDGNGPLTQQQRILAAYNEILAQTTDQQGQFGREAESLPGKQASMAASWENISTRMGIAFLPVAENIIDIVETELIPILEDFADWLNEPETKEGLKDFGESLQIVGDAIAYVVSTTADNFGAVKAMFDFLSGEISFEQLVTQLKELPGFWGDVTNAVYDSGFAIGQWAFDVGNNVRKFGEDIGRGLGIVVANFQALPSLILAVLSGAGTWLVQTGKDIIGGLVRGIKNAGSAVFEAIGGVVTGAIDWAKDLLGIASPSKVFAEMGGYVSQGFARGIESDYSMVRNATSGMASSAVLGAGDTYVQNPFTGDYLLAQVASVAGSVVGAASKARQAAISNGKRS